MPALRIAIRRFTRSTIWRTIAKLHADGLTPDIVTIAAETNGHAAAEYIASLIDECVPENFAQYVRLLREASLERKFCQLGEVLAGTRSHNDRIDLLQRMRGLLDASSTGVHRLREITPLWDLNLPPTEWLIDGLVAEHTVAQWAGMDGSAKTYLVHKLCICRALGIDFLGRRCRQGPVLIVDFENPAAEILRRAQLMAGGPVPELRVWTSQEPKGPPPRLDDSAAVSALLSIANEDHPLIVIDPFRAAHDRDEDSSTEMAPVMRVVREMANDAAGVILIHHVSRSEGSTGRGSTAIRAACDMAYVQEMDPEGTLLTLRCVKNRFGTKPVLAVRADFEAGRFGISGSSAQVEHRNEHAAVHEQIVTHPEGITQSSIARAVPFRKERVLQILAAGEGIDWRRTAGARNSIVYRPICSDQREQFPPSGTVPDSPVPCSHLIDGNGNAWTVRNNSNGV